jgi:rhamnosyltransferase
MSLLEEGHTGVTLFMTLSGYLFAKLTDNRLIDYPRFLWNRFVRLAPLLAVVMVYFAMFHGFGWRDFLAGFVVPRWPSGGWSITVEMHFYVLFPILLMLLRSHGVPGLLAVLAAAILLRAAIWTARDVQSAAYWTIIGCIDQFLFGMIFYKLSGASLFKRCGLATALGVVCLLGLVWHVFNVAGGFYNAPRYPSPYAMWIILPTIQGAAWGCFIAAYENGSFRINPGIGRALAQVGIVSYSIYLLHRVAFLDLIFPYLGTELSFAVASILAFVLFVPMVLVAIVSFECIERPFLALRTGYSKRSQDMDDAREVVLRPTMPGISGQPE